MIKPFLTEIVLIFTLFLQFCVSVDFKHFDDSIQYRLNWPGKSDISSEKDLNELSGYIVVQSFNKEKYNCTLPVLKKKGKVSDEIYDGPNAIELLKPLFQTPSCFSRIETYWTYEICHGRHIRQYHEEKDSKKIKLQEYVLGIWQKHMTAELSDTLDRLNKEGGFNPPSKKVDGVNVPYLELNYTDGTFCDLINEPRQISVHYMCLMKTIKTDVLAVNEIATCFYQVNVFTQHLCKHPKYKAEEMENNDINCYPLNDAPDKPRSLMAIEAESNLRKRFSPPTVQIFYENTISSSLGKSSVKQPQPPPSMPIPLSLQDFLMGKNCLRGGSGWWKYQFCYGKHVEQFHIENKPEGGVEKTSILLGIFNKNDHLAWIKANPHKRPKPLAERTTFSQYYTHGDVCDKTNKERRTEVRLKCVEAAGTVTLYLLEPRLCNYILGVESPLICDLLHRVDDDGLIDYSKDRPPTLAEALLDP